MNPSGAVDDPSVWPGMVVAIILLSAGLTFLVSLILLRAYRRETIQGMNRIAGVPKRPPKPPRLDPGWSPPRLEIQTLEGGSSKGLRPEHLLPSLRGLGWVYAVAGIGYALVMGMAWALPAGFSPTRFLMLTTIYLWPLVLTLALVTSASRGERMTWVLGYLGMLLLVGGGVVAVSENASLISILMLWGMMNGPATLLLLAFLHRRVRSVGPLVLPFMMAGVTGAFLILPWDVNARQGLEGIVTVGMRFGLDATGILVVMSVLGFVTLGLVGWCLWIWLGKAYERKQFSDQSLLVDAMWLFFGLVHPLALIPEGGFWFLGGIIGFVVYRVIKAAGLGILRGRKGTPGDQSGPNLLLLRVFALGVRSEQFFDGFSKWWLRLGSLSLIAGPDLVMRSIEPDEFLGFVTRRHGERFVESEARARQRSNEIDRGRDPDGRYRVTESFCHADTWKATMQTLAAGSDAILMDLRGFGASNEGCVWELGQLLDGVDLKRVLFLVDHTTDQALLERKLQEQWQEVLETSPNVQGEQAIVRCFSAETATSKVVRKLIHELWPA